jgi:hypothetical protein
MATSPALERADQIKRRLDEMPDERLALELPDHPDQLPPDWKPEPSHRDPNGRRMRNPNGDYLDFHWGKPKAPGWEGKDHWHWNGGKKHLPPGTNIPDPVPLSVFDKRYWQQVTGLTGGALVLYLIVSEGSRIIFPPRNALPVP